jgi:hypothetical protein
MARFLLMSVLLLAGMTAWAQTSLQGKVTNDKGEPVPFATVALFLKGVAKTGTSTDMDGNYLISGLDPGTYDVEASEVSSGITRVTGVLIAANRQNVLDVKFATAGIDIKEVYVIAYRNPIINLDNTTQGKTVSAEDIRTLPSKNVASIAASSAGVTQADEGKGLSFRGGREDANEVYVDGVRMRGGALPPAQDVEQLEVITGGLPAAVGDVTGGAISITTKGGSKKFTGNVELETSQFLDAFGYNQAVGSLAGPIVKNKNGDPIVSFRVSSVYTKRNESDPSYIGAYKVKDAVLADLKLHPTIAVNGAIQPRAKYLTADDVEHVAARPNAGNQQVDLNGKLEFRLSKGMDLTVSGGYSHNDGRITTFTRNLLSYDRNAERVKNTLRGSVRFRHRIGGESEGDAKEKKGRNVVENAMYTLQGSYSYNTDDYNDPLHKDNLFAYGHVAQFKFVEKPQMLVKLADSNDSLISVLTGYSRPLVGYNAANSSNPGLAAYNEYLTEFAEGGVPAYSTFRTRNGFVQEGDRLIYGYHLGVNQVYNGFHKEQNSTMDGKADLSFDLFPTRTLSNKHSVQLGFVYEQREDRSYTISPRGLWQTAELLANRWFDGLDENNVLRDTTLQYGPNQFGQTSGTAHIYAHKVTGANQYYFAHEIRKKLGLRNYQDVNVENLTANDLNLGMFSADELMVDEGIDIKYNGYDYKGNPIAGGRNNFNSFWTDSTSYQGNDGISFKVPTRNIGAFQPIYMAGYIQDKFTFHDIIFRVGLRIDRFDANTKVMRDIYSLYKTYNAKDFYAKYLPTSTKPASIGDDFIPYIDASNNVMAFRSGDKWYSETGAPITDAVTAFQGRGKAIPATVAEVEKNPKYRITGGSFDPNSSFQDYDPQLNFMPRLAFSFPISDKAGFFAHYDILTSRPLDAGISANYASPLDYYRMEIKQGVTIGNPSLRASRAIDYEVGFQQQLSKTSGLKVQAYYKEMRDQIQEQLVSNAYPSEYTTLTNVVSVIYSLVWLIRCSLQMEQAPAQRLRAA